MRAGYAAPLRPRISIKTSNFILKFAVAPIVHVPCHRRACLRSGVISPASSLASLSLPLPLSLSVRHCVSRSGLLQLPRHDRCVGGKLGERSFGAELRIFLRNRRFLARSRGTPRRRSSRRSWKVMCRQGNSSTAENGLSRGRELIRASTNYPTVRPPRSPES